MSAVDFYIDTVCDNFQDFDSGNPVFNNYLMHREDSAVMHYILEPESDKLIAYFSLLSSSLLFGEITALNSVPAIELKMLAIDKRYQKTGLAPTLINASLLTIQHYSKEYVGAKIILLYSVPADAVVTMYEKCGFQRADGLFTTYTSYFNAGCVPMFKPLW